MRSNLLVHWTGKDLKPEQPISSVADLQLQDGDIVSKYIERLRGILDCGFRMSRPPERIEGGRRGDEHPKTLVGHSPPIVCFTENRLSQAFLHAFKYGFLGLAVGRKFVLDRFGGPVQYLRNHPNEQVVAKLEEVGMYLVENAKRDPDAYGRLADAFSFTACFYKAMSSEPGSDSFDLLDEHEWRLVRTTQQVALGNIVECGVETDAFYVPLKPADLQMVIVPNDQVRTAVWSDNDLRKRISGGDRPPVLLTVEECLQF